MNEIFIWLSNYFLFFGWRDILEITFFSALFYYFSLWLSTDTKKNLVIAFYSYWLMAFAAYGLQLTTMSWFLFIASPISMLLFIIVHQQFLQQNFITLKNKIPAVQSHENWIELLIRVCLQTINKNKEIVIIIQQTDNLHDMLYVPFHIDTSFDATLLTLLIEGSSYDQTKYVWITNEGRLLGINATWHRTIAQEWFDQSAQNLQLWKQDALALTHKTDGLVIGITPTTRTFSIITAGKLLEPLQADAAIRILRKILLLPHDTKQGVVHEQVKSSYNHQIQS